MRQLSKTTGIWYHEGARKCYLLVYYDYIFVARDGTRQGKNILSDVKISCLKRGLFHPPPPSPFLPSSFSLSKYILGHLWKSEVYTCSPWSSTSPLFLNLTSK